MNDEDKFNEIDAETEFYRFMDVAKRTNILDCLKKYTDKITISYFIRFGNCEHDENNWKYFDDIFNHYMKTYKEFNNAMIKLKNVDVKCFDYYYSVVSTFCF